MPLPQEQDPLAQIEQATDTSKGENELQAAMRALEGDPTPTPNPDLKTASEGKPEGEKLGPEGEPPQEGEPPTDATEGERKRWAALAKQTRKVEQREKRAQELLKQAETRIQDAEKKAQEASAFFDQLRKPDGLASYLKGQGLKFDDVAQLFLGIEKTETEQDRLARLEKQLADRDEQEKAQKKAAEEARIKAESDAIYTRDLTQVVNFIDSLGDQFELVRANKSYEDVYKRAYFFLRDNDIQHVEDPEEIKTLISHFASEVEQELEQQVTDLTKKLSGLNKVKKLGIFPHTKSTSTSDAEIRDNLETLDPDYLAAMQKAGIKDNIPSKPSKFLTNEATVTSRPVPKETSPSGYAKSGSQLDWEQIQELTKLL